MIMNIKIHNIFILLKFKNLWNLINVLINKKIWKYLFKCFLWIFKVQWVQENQGVTFLMVSPKDVFTHLKFKNLYLIFLFIGLEQGKAIVKECD
jgi:hypothetical protein